MNKDLLEDGRGSKESPPNRRMGGWEAAYHFGCRLIMSGYGGGALGCITLVALAHILFGGMESGDKKEVLGNVFVALAFLGWIGFAATIIIARKILRFQASRYEQEISRINVVKERALEQGEFKLDSETKN